MGSPQQQHGGQRHTYPDLLCKLARLGLGVLLAAENFAKLVVLGVQLVVTALDAVSAQNLAQAQVRLVHRLGLAEG